MGAAAVTKRMLTKTIREHWCGGREMCSPNVKKPMDWQPVEVLKHLRPELAKPLGQCEPAMAAFCPDCRELWVVVLKE